MLEQSSKRPKEGMYQSRKHQFTLELVDKDEVVFRYMYENDEIKLPSALSFDAAANTLIRFVIKGSEAGTLMMTRFTQSKSPCLITVKVNS